MLHGKVLRPPALGATLVSVDLDAPPRRCPASKVVRDGEFVGVAAAERAAGRRRRRDALQARVDSPRRQPSSDGRSSST